MLTNAKAKQILIYGDSYTFGKIPGGLRYDAATRYTGVVQRELGSDYEIIEEGLRGRMLVGENGFLPHRNGLEQFDGIFGSHLPIDLMIFFLGINDCNKAGILSPNEIVKNYTQYLVKIDWWCEHLEFPHPKVMLVAPPLINESASHAAFSDWFDGSEVKVKQLSKLIETFALANKLFFFDSTKFVTTSPIDGIHLDVENNRILGLKLAQSIKEFL